MSLSGTEKLNYYARGSLSLFINMLCDGKDAIHMCTKFDVYVFYYILASLEETCLRLFVVV